MIKSSRSLRGPKDVSDGGGNQSTYVGGGRNPVGDASRQQKPVPRTRRVHVVLDIFVRYEEHSHLQFEELFPERQLRRLQRDKVGVDQFNVTVLLVLVARVPMLFDVEKRVLVGDHGVADNFKLVVRPVGKRAARKRHSHARVDVHEADQRLEGVPHVANFVAVGDFHSPYVLSRHGDVVVNVTADFLLNISRNNNNNKEKKRGEAK